MLINRNNYETFFLLYADDELRVDERIVVEEFVAENEDLKGELNMLLAAILPVEEIKLTDKSFLYKEVVFDAALQEKLLLKIDGELSPAELITVNNLITSDASVQEEYQSLLGTKLSADDKIIFEQKHLLYKKEKDNVIAFGWLRWVAAAILIGFGLFFGINFFSRKNIVENALVVNTKPDTNSLKNTQTDIINTPSNNDTVSTIAINQNGSKVIIKENQLQQNKLTKDIAVNKKEKPESILKDKNVKADPAKEEITAVNKVTEKVQPLQTIITEKGSVQDIAALKITEKNKAVLANENIVPLENTYAQAVSFTAAEKSQNKILYMDEDDVKRSKVGGFFKKIKRIVERTANIKTGNSISIAGFEIAAK